MKNIALSFLAVAAIGAALLAFAPPAEANPTRNNVETKNQVLRLAGGNAGCVTVDFGQVGGTGAYTTCRESSAFTIANAQLGDSCLASTATFDGGLPTEARLTCSIITTAQAKVKLCLDVTDAGALDVGSAEYCGRIIR